MTLIAYWLSCCWVRSPEIAIQMIGAVLVSTLATTGGSASFGSRRSTWFTLACTSLKATSMRLSRLKVMLICDTPGEEVDWMCSMPGTLLTDALDDVGDRGVDDVGVRALERGLHRDHRKLDVGQLVHADALVGDEAEQHQHGVQHHREDVTLDGELGQRHDAPPLPRRRDRLAGPGRSAVGTVAGAGPTSRRAAWTTATFALLVRKPAPSTATVSPPASPAVISIRPPCRYAGLDRCAAPPCAVLDEVDHLAGRAQHDALLGHHDRIRLAPGHDLGVDGAAAAELPVGVELDDHVERAAGGGDRRPDLVDLRLDDEVGHRAGT